MKKSTIHINFTHPKKFNLWIVGVSPSEIRIKDSDGVFRTVGKYETTGIDNPAEIEFGKVRIISDVADIKINGKSIGVSINAVIDESEKIMMDAFIRSFDR